MRIALILIIGLTSMFAIWFFVQREPAGNSDAVLAALRAAVPDLEQADVALEQCQLSMRRQATAEQGQITQFSAFDADLRLFEFQTVRIADREDGSALLVISRKPVSEALMAQVTPIVNAFSAQDLQAQEQPVPQPMEEATGEAPAPEQPEPPLTEAGQIAMEDVRKILEQPGATMRFTLTAELPDGTLESAAALPPHADAPAFFAFSEAVLGLAPPRTFSVSQLFQGVDRAAGALIAGQVAVPAEIRFTVRSRDVAQSLGETLFRYTAQTCGL